VRAAICKYLKDYKKVSYVPDQILCTNGAKQSVYQALLCLICPHDEVLIPSPYWVSYPDIVTMVGGEPVFLDTYAADGYSISPESVAAAITPRTRVLILCNPSNPTGAVQKREVLEGIAAVLRKPENKHVLVLSDEIYERIVFDEEHVCFAALEGMYERTITINGFSKAYSMTGFRLGFMAAPMHITNPCKKILSQVRYSTE
jgi:aspartate/methionine/tyrosine aminotransferase